MKIPKQIKIDNRIFNLIKIYKNFAKYQNEQGWYECFNFQELGLVESAVPKYRKLYRKPYTR